MSDPTPPSDAPRPRRGRPRSFDPEQALWRATERFRTRGFAGTSLDDLADATGLNRPSLYAAFGDKKALYLAAIAGLTDRVEASFDRLAAAQLPLRAMVERMLVYAVDLYFTGETGAGGCLIIGTATAEAAADAEVRAALAHFLAMEDRRIEALLVAAGSPAPAAHARIIASVLQALSIRARAGESRDALVAIAHDTAALFG